MNRILKSILFLINFLLVGHIAYAQMSDTQIVEYVKTQSSRGVDKKQIAKELTARGATMEQLQRLRSQYEQQQAQSVVAATEATDRQRVSNGEAPVAAPAPSHSHIFGHDIFRTENLTFAPDMNIPTPADYTLGAGDEVIIDIYGSSQLNLSCTISPDGSIIVPNEGPIHVAGLTASQAQDRLRATIGSHYADSEIKLTIGQTRTILIHVMGEVKTPGSYTVSAFANAFNVLYLSGGMTEIGTMRDVQISRGGKVIAHIDLYDFILNGTMKGDIALRDNDIIRVGTYQNLVRLEGKVKRPMHYEMKADENLADLIRYAGGMTGDAYTEKVRVERKDIDGLTVFNVKERDMASFHNMDGDNVVVLAALNRYRQTVTVEGAVFRPGAYRLGGDVHSVRTLIEMAGGLDEKAVTDLAVLIRLRADRTPETLPVKLNDILYGSAADIELQNEDRLIISSTYLRDQQQIIRIRGEVFHPGEFPYSAGETVATLIVRAGGLKESADNTIVEVARRITTAEADPDGKTMAQILRVSPTDDMLLMPYDEVTIVRSAHYKEQRAVYIQGEVKNAGAYVLATAEERLSGLIERAGGLTENAFVGGVQIIRVKTDREQRLLQKELEAARTEQDSIRIMTDMAKDSYTIGIDLAAAMQNPGSAKDLIVKEYDIITIPQQNNTVKINGAVLSPNTVNFECGKTLSYYLNQAGGVSRQGRRCQAYILYANGLKSKATRGRVQPGCEIIVPTREKREINPQAASIGLSTASVLASVAVVISTIIRK